MDSIIVSSVIRGNDLKHYTGGTREIYTTTVNFCKRLAHSRVLLSKVCPGMSALRIPSDNCAYEI